MRPARTTTPRHSGFSPGAKVLFFLSVVVTGAMVAYRVQERSISPEFEGTVVGNEVEVSSEISGKLEWVAVEPNMPVEAGQLLAEICEETLPVEIAAASDEIEKLQEALEQARNDETLLARLYDLQEKVVEASGEASLLESEIVAVRKEIDAGSQTLAVARDRLERAASLFEKEALTRTHLESRQLAVVEAEAKVEEAVSRLDRMTRRTKHLRDLIALYDARRIEVRRETNTRLTELEIEIRKKQGDLRTLLARQSSLKVYSRHAGVVSQLPRSVGEYVSAGQPILFLKTRDRLWVEARIPADRTGLLGPGDRVEILTHSHHGGPATGWVKGILPTVRTLSRSSVGMFEERYKIVVALVEFDDEESAKSSFLVGQEVTVRQTAPGWGRE